VCSTCGEDENSYFYKNLVHRGLKEVDHLRDIGIDL
jgi:hypothetical protein